MGQRLISRLLERGHEVRALVRSGSEKKLPADALQFSAMRSTERAMPLRSLPRTPLCNWWEWPIPAPAKAAGISPSRSSFRIGRGGSAAKCAGIRHFVYLSVAHPAPMMHAYIAVRTECEGGHRHRAGLNATILRPWYVLGPGHWWPYAAAFPCTKTARTLARNPRRGAAAGLGDLGADDRLH